MNKKDSIETSIILNLEREYKLFTKASKDSLILKWFKSHGINKPIQSKKAFKYKVTFIGQKDDPKYTGLGIIIYPTPKPYSKAFVGKFKEGKRHGVGWRLLNKELFIGKYKGDAKDGKAIIFRIENDKRLKIFDGEFNNGKKHGDCYIEEKDYIFEGKVLNGLYHGFCKIYYKNGNYFEGTMTKGSISGSGIVKYNNGDIYEGGFLENKRYGEGSYIFKSDVQSILGESDNSINNFESIQKKSTNLKNFIKENKNIQKNQSSSSTSISKSGLYTDWSYCHKRPSEDLD